MGFWYFDELGWVMNEVEKKLFHLLRDIVVEVECNVLEASKEAKETEIKLGLFKIIGANEIIDKYMQKS